MHIKEPLRPSSSWSSKPTCDNIVDSFSCRTFNPSQPLTVNPGTD